MSIVLVVDLPTWFVGTTGVCALAAFVWQGRTRTVQCDSRATPAPGDDAWYVVPNMTPPPVGETTHGADEMLPRDVVEPDELVIGDCASRNVAKTAPVAVPVRLADTTSAQYYFTACGGRMHTRTTCRGLRNAIQILGSSTHEISGKTACRLCFPVAQLASPR